MVHLRRFSSSSIRSEAFLYCTVLYCAVARMESLLGADGMIFAGTETGTGPGT